MPRYSMDHGVAYQPPQTQPINALQPPSVYNPAIHGYQTPGAGSGSFGSFGRSQQTGMQGFVGQYQQMQTSPYASNIQNIQGQLSNVHQRSGMVGAGVGLATDIGVGLAASAAGGAVAGLPGALAGGYFANKLGVGEWVGEQVQKATAWSTGENERRALLQSAMQREQRQQQLQQFSQQFIQGGRSAGPGMQGWNRGATQRFEKELTGMTDITPGGADPFKMFQMGMQQDMFRGQDPSMMARQLESVIKNVKTFMLVAKSPDLQGAMEAMGDLYRMGFNPTQQNFQQMLPQMKQMARASGYAPQQMGQFVNNVMAPGAQGFMQMGIPGQFGAQAGMYTQGLANTAANNTNLPNWKLQMMGGAQGMQQSLMQGVGTSQMMLQQMMPSLVTFQEGRPQVNMERVRRFRAGMYTTKDLQQMQKDTMGSGTERLIRQQQLQEFMPGLMGSIQETMTPQDQMQMVNRMANEMIVKSKGRMTRFTALSRITGSQQGARAFQQASRPENIIQMRQLERAAQIEQEQLEANLSTAEGGGGMLSAMKQATGIGRRQQSVSRTVNLSRVGGVSQERLMQEITKTANQPIPGSIGGGTGYIPVSGGGVSSAFDIGAMNPAEQYLREFMGQTISTKEEAGKMMLGLMGGDDTDQGYDIMRGGLSLVTMGLSETPSIYRDLTGPEKRGRGAMRVPEGVRRAMDFDRLSAEDQRKQLTKAGKDVRYFSALKQEATAYGQAPRAKVKAQKAIRSELSDVASPREIDAIVQTATSLMRKNAKIAARTPGGRFNPRDAMTELMGHIRQKFNTNITVDGKKRNKSQAIIEKLGEGNLQYMVGGIALDRLTRTATPEEKKIIANSEKTMEYAVDAQGLTQLKTEVQDSEDFLKTRLGEALASDDLTEVTEFLRKTGLTEPEEIEMLQEYLKSGALGEGMSAEEIERLAGSSGDPLVQERATNVLQAANIFNNMKKSRQDIFRDILTGAPSWQNVAGREDLGSYKEKIEAWAGARTGGRDDDYLGHLSRITKGKPQAEAISRQVKGISQILGMSQEKLMKQVDKAGGFEQFLLQEAIAGNRYYEDILKESTLAPWMLAAEKGQEITDPKRRTKYMEGIRGQYTQGIMEQTEQYGGSTYTSSKGAGKRAPKGGAFAQAANDIIGAADKFTAAADTISVAANTLKGVKPNQPGKRSTIEKLFD